MSTSLQELAALGQSIWYDNIQRSLLTNGELAGMIRQDSVTGLTSNPSIFEKAIAHSADYDAEISASLSQRPVITLLARKNFALDPRDLRSLAYTLVRDTITKHANVLLDRIREEI